MKKQGFNMESITLQMAEAFKNMKNDPEYLAMIKDLDEDTSPELDFLNEEGEWWTKP